MTKGLSITTLALAALLVSAPAGAQRRRATTGSARSGAEGGLLGVKLYDSGLRVVSLYGNPDQIQPIAGGGTAAGGGGGAGAEGGRGSRSGLGGPAGRGGLDNMIRPEDENEISSRQNVQPGPPPPPTTAGAQGGGGSAPSGGGGAPGGSAPSGGGGTTTSTSGDFTRLVYTKSGSKFGFVLDKFNRVVQIEAIGLQNSRVKTRRGIGFGSTFSQVMKAYGVSSPPDGYDVAGDQVTVKFLTRQRVAFRLTKLGGRQAHVVTGIVVAAGKG